MHKAARVLAAAAAAAAAAESEKCVQVLVQLQAWNDTRLMLLRQPGNI